MAKVGCAILMHEKKHGGQALRDHKSERDKHWLADNYQPYWLDQLSLYWGSDETMKTFVG
jgi:hypothetical protein